MQHKVQQIVARLQREPWSVLQEMTHALMPEPATCEL